MAIKLIIGLRNPGSDYEHTRHNAGGWLVETLAQQLGGTFKIEKQLHCELAQLVIDGHICKTILPLTFMNHSGLPAKAVSQFYRFLPEEILVAHDDLDLPAGRIKIKSGGGHGGHNGLRDIASHLGSTAFHRLRIGIGHPGHRDLVLNYVLGKPSKQDKQFIFEAIERAIKVLPIAVAGNMIDAMNQLNG